MLVFHFFTLATNTAHIINNISLYNVVINWHANQPTIALYLPEFIVWGCSPAFLCALVSPSCFCAFVWGPEPSWSCPCSCSWWWEVVWAMIERCRSSSLRRVVLSSSLLLSCSCSRPFSLCRPCSLPPASLWPDTPSSWAPPIGDTVAPVQSECSCWPERAQEDNNTWVIQHFNSKLHIIIILCLQVLLKDFTCHCNSLLVTKYQKIETDMCHWIMQL